MVKLRLARHGRRHRPVYHLVAADARAPRDGRFIEKLGTYHPCTAPAQLWLTIPRALYWLGQGAQPTRRVRDLFRSQGVMLQHHLEVGVHKGKVTPEEATARLVAWKERYGAKHQQRVQLVTTMAATPSKEAMPPASPSKGETTPAATKEVAKPAKQKASKPAVKKAKEEVTPKPATKKKVATKKVRTPAKPKTATNKPAKATTTKK